MISFIIAILTLIAAYFIYGKIVDKHFGSDSTRKTPALTKTDGIDFTPMPTWKVFVIQFLNIAGLGPIFGAILGAAYGPVAYIWIVLGCIFMGAVHDYFSGMLSLRNDGLNMPQIAGKYIGKGMKWCMIFIVCFLLLSVGVSFVTGPADLIASLTGVEKEIWLYVIFAYYIIATLLPIDKIIGNIYPFMGGVLLFMAIAVAVMMITNDIKGLTAIPELTLGSLKNYHSNPEKNILIPMLCVVISCGAISGFHATQSPLMARCLKNEKHARPVFYGAMIAEGVVALIWASAAMSFFGGPEGLNEAGVTPAIAVNMICNSWLGKVGAIIAIIGVVFCPISSGDTAFRSLRLTIADIIKSDQKPIAKRLLISIPIFLVAYICCKVDFSTIWLYFGIANQSFAALSLWTASAYLIKSNKNHLMTSIPASFLTFICVSYFMVAPHSNGGLFLQPLWGYITGGIIAISLFIYCLCISNTKQAISKNL